MNSVSTLSIAIATSNALVLTGFAGPGSDPPQPFAAILAPFDAAATASVRQNPAATGNALPVPGEGRDSSAGIFVSVPATHIEPHRTPDPFVRSVQPFRPSDGPQPDRDDKPSIRAEDHQRDEDHDASDPAQPWTAAPVAPPVLHTVSFTTPLVAYASTRTTAPAFAEGNASTAILAAPNPGEPIHPRRPASALETPQSSITPAIPIQPQRPSFAVASAPTPQSAKDRGRVADLIGGLSDRAAPTIPAPHIAGPAAPAPRVIDAPTVAVTQSDAISNRSVLSRPGSPAVEPRPAPGEPAPPIRFTMHADAPQPPLGETGSKRQFGTTVSIARAVLPQPGLPALATDTVSAPLTPALRSLPEDSVRVSPSRLALAVTRADAPQPPLADTSAGPQFGTRVSVARPTLPQPWLPAVEMDPTSAPLMPADRSLPADPARVSPFQPDVAVTIGGTAGPWTADADPEPTVSKIAIVAAAAPSQENPVSAKAPVLPLPGAPRSGAPTIVAGLADAALAPAIAVLPASQPSPQVDRPQPIARDATAIAGPPTPLSQRIETTPGAPPPAAIAAAIPTVALAPPGRLASPSAPSPKRVRDDAAPATDVAFGVAAPTPSAPAITIAQNVPLDMGRHGWPQAMIDRIEALRDATDAVDTSIRIVPDKLGTIDVSVRRDGDVTHVHFTAEQAQTRNILADAQPRLAELADARGLKLGHSSIESGTGTGTGQQPQHHRPPHATFVPAAPVRARRDATTTDHRIA